jgi:hypothetical protein
LDGIFDWYWVGVALGLGVAAGIPGPRRESGRLFGGFVLVAAAAAGVIAAVVTAWAAIAALAGVAIGVFSFRHLARTAVPAAALALAALAFVPVLGYLTALGAPILGERLRRRAAGRYAGLRILAKD